MVIIVIAKIHAMGVHWDFISTLSTNPFAPKEKKIHEVMLTLTPNCLGPY